MNKTVEEEIEMSPFESELAQAILGELEYRGFYDCGKYLDDGLIERIRPIIQKELTSQRQTLREEIGKLSKEQDGKATMTFSDGSTADIKLHSDMALGYNQALADVLSLIDNN